MPPLPAFVAALPLSQSRPSAACTHRRLARQCPVATAGTTASSSNGATPLLVRAARGEPVPRPPVWLMRQAGRYMADFRAFSDHHPFRHRSETPDIAFELSMQPYRAFATDAVIMFSDILTPLPALGIDFDIVSGKGPRIPDPIRTIDQARRFASASFDPASSLPFVAELLKRLRDELASEPAALVGFVGAPFTLAAYAIEGAAAKNIVATKRLMYSSTEEEQVLSTVLDKLGSVVADYAVFQVRQGAQVIQFFDSWAHHLSPDQYSTYALPAARKAAESFKAQCPKIPLIFFANGAGGKLEMIQDQLGHVVDVVGIDWSVSMSDARRRLGKDVVLQGNVDPSILATGSEDAIRKAVRDTVSQADGPLILNLGHGVIKETPEDAVGVFCDAARNMAAAEVVA
ncbi:unnamed protein product [Chondrus crispus]|uniref:Uroporphyrinogen decarboxylase n=1 Tax=Chondrus crispus TaxID=2769 RepID=R7Q901_CHOCR|nr:unnamed protein product [Chondrus crispus]CDF34977.1 unnamed protein product [Chondrus crispus]|eukprot:XP_005714796.1 unnamed protein product [Chondrus crispus]